MEASWSGAGKPGLPRPTDPAIEKWISAQMKGRSCTVVLIGEKTAKRKWIEHEIINSWKHGMSVVGVRIHGLKNKDGYVSKSGANPFSSLNFGDKKFSSVVECYGSAGSDSKERYEAVSG
ncbi:MAG: TIR domain-containing protein [Kofleriaceae bacterium]|nr:TIR domain-containing protein [Kofleriaceae bacterium]